MTKTIRYAAATAMALLLASCGWFSSKPPHVSADKVAEARKYIEDEAVYNPASAAPVDFRVFGVGQSHIKSIDITPRKLRIVTETDIPSAGSVFVFPLKNLTPGSGCDDITCLASIHREGDLYFGGYYMDYTFYLPRKNDKNAPQTVYDLGYALSVLKQAALQERSSDPQFEQVVDNYQAASPKPALPETAQRLKTAAENAAGDNQFDNAADDYAEALEIAPWWPEGHRGLALALAQLNDYRGAADEMKCYLMLVPDAGDKKDAEHKIKDWEKKARKQGS